MTPHLRGNVRAYVDRALPPAILHIYDRHLVCCQTCRGAADQERRIVASLRTDTGFVPGNLRSSLMGLAAVPEPGSAQAPDGGPRIPLGPFALRGSAEPTPRNTVPTVAPSAPALHRSPMRAAVVASLAAGASVAAAWGLAVAPLPGGTRLPAARIPSGVASFGVGYAPAVVSATTNDESTIGTGRRGGPGATPQYWLVTTRPAAARPTSVAPVRVSFVGSAQSGP